MSARNACSVMVAGEKKSLALSSLSGKPGTFIIPAYSTGGLPPTAWVISAVIDWLGSVLRSVQESPPSSETKMGAVALAEPPGFGVKAEAAMSFGFEAYSARNGSASCQGSPLSGTGVKSTTRTPASLPVGPWPIGRSQATHNPTAAAITPARMTHAPRSRPPPCPYDRILGVGLARERQASKLWRGTRVSGLVFFPGGTKACTAPMTPGVIPWLVAGPGTPCHNGQSSPTQGRINWSKATNSQVYRPHSPIAMA